MLQFNNNISNQADRGSSLLRYMFCHRSIFACVRCMNFNVTIIQKNSKDLAQKKTLKSSKLQRKTREQQQQQRATIVFLINIIGIITCAKGFNLLFPFLICAVRQTHMMCTCCALTQSEFFATIFKSIFLLMIIFCVLLFYFSLVLFSSLSLSLFFYRFNINRVWDALLYERGKMCM